MVKPNNHPYSIDDYFKEVALFQGMMNQCANSIEIVLDGILEKVGSCPILLGRKINELEKSKSSLERLSVSFDELLTKLRRFNFNWTISKHGMAVAGEKIRDVTLRKDGVQYVFDRKKVEEIRQEFTQIQILLVEIHNKQRGKKQI
jgi:hypothetical protein